MTAWWLERALLPSGVADGVRVEVVDGRFASVQPGVEAGDANRLAGLTIPGLANCHSHAFHRALRGRTHGVGAGGPGSFWTWREQMYAVAGRLDPDGYLALARAVYREMALGGITTVGEFHYLHHGPDGTPYDDPNAMSHALVEAGRQAGVRVVLLDTCYLAAGIGREPEGVQRRFADGTAETWAERVSAFDAPHVGAAVHSVRAVPRDQVPVVAAWADGRRAALHVHLSEQVAENDECLAAHGLTPAELLADAGALGERTSVVHATHLSATDVALLGESGSAACFCPTTERDLGDGIGPSRALRAAGSPLTLGSDSHAVVDLFEEMRAVELDERLATQRRGHWSATELLAAATTDGHRSLGLADAGRIEVGARADLVTLDVASPRTAGTGAGEATAVFAATAADVLHIVADGVVVATADDRHDVGAELDRVIRKVWET